jgi:hypothetical protein
MMRGKLLTSVIQGLALLGFLTIPGAAGALPPLSTQDPGTGFVYTCPAAPPGWKAWGGDPYLESQFVGGTGAESGSDQETVSCDYFLPSGRGVWVSANLALPLLTVNPFSDFFVGCKANSINYTQPGYTSYFVPSKTRWAYADFTDFYHALGPQDVPTFKGMTRALLHNVEGAAHNCVLDTTHPVAVPVLWGFQFSVSISGSDLTASTKGTGYFVTQGGPTKDNHLKVTRMYGVGDGYTMKETSGGVTHTLTLNVSDPTFQDIPPFETLTLAVTVASSDEPLCPQGSTGTFTLTTNQGGATIGKLALCDAPGQLLATTRKIQEQVSGRINST